MGMASATISNIDRQVNPSLDEVGDYPNVEKVVNMAVKYPSDDS